MSLAVADNDNRIETEPAPTFHYLRNTVDVHELIFQFQLTCFDPCQNAVPLFLSCILVLLTLSGEDSNLYKRLQRPLSCH